MPPKKGDGPKQPPIIGRFGTSLKIGIVGLPNVGYVSVPAAILSVCMCAGSIGLKTAVEKRQNYKAWMLELVAFY